jgi:heme/copper-type cytochrome/quinol oxidase subunit 2
MSAAPETQAEEAARRRRWMITGVVIAILAIVIAVIGVTVGVWLFFFGDPAPAAPTLDDALQVLQSAAPAE